MKTILFQGDSITDGGRYYDNPNSLGFGYPAFVTGHLGVEFPGEYKTINRGVSGNRIVDLYARIKTDIINLKPDIMSILIGVNDVWHEFGMGNGVEPEKFFRIYDMLITEVKEALPEIKIMIMGPYTLKGAGNEAYWEPFYEDVLEHAKKAEEIAKKHNLVYVPLQEVFEKAAETAPNDVWLEDGVHATAVGYELIKREWLKGFAKL